MELQMESTNLDQLVIAGNLEYPPALLPEGWAAVLHLYNLR